MSFSRLTPVIVGIAIVLGILGYIVDRAEHGAFCHLESEIGSSVKRAVWIEPVATCSSTSTDDDKKCNDAEVARQCPLLRKAMKQFLGTLDILHSSAQYIAAIILLCGLVSLSIVDIFGPLTLILSFVLCTGAALYAIVGPLLTAHNLSALKCAGGTTLGQLGCHMAPALTAYLVGCTLVLVLPAVAAMFGLWLLRIFYKRMEKAL